jgi:phosphate uptake regulator
MELCIDINEGIVVYSRSVEKSNMSHGCKASVKLPLMGVHLCALATVEVVNFEDNVDRRQENLVERMKALVVHLRIDCLDVFAELMNGLDLLHVGSIISFMSLDP